MSYNYSYYGANPYAYLSYPIYRNAPATAYAQIKGGPLAENLSGYVFFMQAKNGVDVFVEVSGLPPFQPAKEGRKQIGPHGFHIHENGSCEIGDPKDPFKAAGEHWNPTNQPHGNHAGDFPVLFSNNGYARMVFFTNKFEIKDIIGKAVIIHQGPDDFHTQPAGDAGKRLACGVISEVRYQ